jgi:hypothetical protein
MPLASLGCPLDIVGCIRGLIDAAGNEEAQRLIKDQLEDRVKAYIDKGFDEATKRGLPGWFYSGKTFISPDEIFSLSRKEALEYIAFRDTGASEAKCNAFAYGFEPDRWAFTRGAAHGAGFHWTCNDVISGESFKSIRAARASDQKRSTQGDDSTLPPPPPEASSAVSIIQGQSDESVNGSTTDRLTGVKKNLFDDNYVSRNEYDQLAVVVQNLKVSQIYYLFLLLFEELY